ncbi:hypothetical protein NHQ30_003728 [Ciborinia camelliae]|nr:hypothetical protein NHQ30_003728 [Ciborinia camelliae]
MLSPQIWRAMKWRHVVNTDYDGAVLVGGLENELRHFGDPDEEHDFWRDPSPVEPCPYTREGARAIAAAEKKENQQKLRAARRSAVLGISHYENNASHENCQLSHKDSVETVVEDEEREEKDEEDGFTVEVDGEPLEFHDDWFGGDLPADDVEHEVGFEDCSQCGGVLRGQTVDTEETNNCELNDEETITTSVKRSGTSTDQEDDANDLDLGESFVFMFDEEFEAKGDAEKTRKRSPSNEPPKGRCFCRCDDSVFVEIDNTNIISGLNGIEKNPCPARAVIAAQPGLWRSMAACRPFERARRPHIVRPGSWQAV